MDIDARVKNRFEQLEAQARAVRIETGDGGTTWVDAQASQQWASSVMNLVFGVFGKDSPHYKNLEIAYKYVSYSETHFRTMVGIFKGSKDDYENGFLFNLSSTISGEIFGDFVVAAKEALASQQKDVAAVLVCAALEDALKRYATLNGIKVDHKDMTQVINALKGAGLVSGPHKALLDAMPRVRNAALHADWGNITSQDVGSVIGYVEQFLLIKFR